MLANVTACQLTQDTRVQIYLYDGTGISIDPQALPCHRSALNSRHEGLQ